MEDAKPCEQCGQTFIKPLTCGRPEWSRRRFCSQACKADSQRGMTPWNKGMHSESTAQRVPCRICGDPTRHPGGPRSPLIGKIACSKPECVAASRRLKNERISQRANAMFAAGFRKKNQPGWRNVSRVSAEEEALRSWFEAMGWQAQYHVLTHVHTNKLPRHFDLDFANPENHLYVEVDGESHTIPNRRERDARRDAMLAERGWTGLRIPSAAVRSNIEDAKLTIATWIDRQ